MRTTHWERRRAFAGLAAVLVLLLTGCGAAVEGVDYGSGGGFGGGGGTVGTGTATLSWDPPTTNEDGTPLTDLDGYKIYFGKRPGLYSSIVDVPSPDTTQYMIGSLAAGTYYFAVLAYDSSDNLSRFSEEVVKTIP